MWKGTVRGRREFLRLAVTGTGVMLLAACTPAAPTAPTAAPSQPTAGTAPPPAGPAPAAPAAKPAAQAVPAAPAAKAADKPGRELIGQLEGPEVVLDPAKYPKSFKEAPELAELVKAGKLPPVQQRIGDDPLVVKPLREIGKYGGTMRRAFIGPVDRQNANRMLAGPDNLLWFDYEWKKVIPNIARGYELSPDGKVTTVFVRKGMRWSDGQPFSADDIMFWFEDLYQNKQLVPNLHPNMTINGKPGTVEKVDTLTVRFVFPDPYPLFPEILAGWTGLGGQSLSGLDAMGGYAPKHYLQQFLPKYVPQDQLDQKARDAKFDSWVALFKARNSWHLNPELPVLTPWKTTQPINTPNWVMERNPYSIWVDTDGNQLPYINAVSMTLAENLEVLNLRAIAGEYDFQNRHIDMAKLPLLLENQQKSGYKVYLDPAENIDYAIRVNLSYEADPEIGDLFRTADFRRALSLGIDRDQINESFFLGTGTPSSLAPADTNKYFPGPEYRSLWSNLDVKKANDLLDKLGLDKKDGEGYRQRQDGKGRLRLDYNAASGSNADYIRMGEMVREHWKKIGVELNVQAADGNLLVQRGQGNELQLWGLSGGSEDLFTFPEFVFPFTTTGPGASVGPLFARWFQTGGKEGKEPPARIKQVMDQWRTAIGAPEAERVRMGKEIFKIVVDDVFMIGVVGMGLAVYGVRIAKTNLGNIPARVINATPVKSPTNALPQTFFFK